MATTTDNKFETHGLLAPSDRFPKGQPFAPVPRFIFRQWQLHSDDNQWERGLPTSFWITVLFVIDATLGGSLAGVEGKIAQSQIPVEKKDAARWIAAMGAYKDGSLIEVDYYQGTDHTQSSTFRVNPNGTQADWEYFFFVMRLAWLEGHVSREKSVEDIKEYFRKLPGSEKWRPPLWSAMLPVWDWLNKATEAEIDEVRANWVKRGFDMCDWIKHEDEYPRFSENEMAKGSVLWLLCHIAWKSAKAEDAAPLLPDNAKEIMAMLNNTYWVDREGTPDETMLADVLARFHKVQHPEHGPCLEYPWLTKQWQAAKANAEWEKKAAAMDVELGWKPSGGAMPPEEFVRGHHAA